jgi:RimJ/RimL family protein N-acetyltransferase
MKGYLCLNEQIFTEKDYSICPIRVEDKFLIMRWRNEQIYHLRQSKPLTEEDQIKYFDEVVLKLFHETRPVQILFSYLNNSACIGYGGLVHINWIDRNAEISFIMDTRLEETSFMLHWNQYLKLIEKVAFVQLGLHKIYVYAFDIRPKLYKVLENSGYIKDAVLKDHCRVGGIYKDVIIYSKWNLK